MSELTMYEEMLVRHLILDVVMGPVVMLDDLASVHEDLRVREARPPGLEALRRCDEDR